MWQCFEFVNFLPSKIKAHNTIAEVTCETYVFLKIESFLIVETTFPGFPYQHVFIKLRKSIEYNTGL